jgi:hypothetical protein
MSNTVINSYATKTSWFVHCLAFWTAHCVLENLFTLWREYMQYPKRVCSGYGRRTKPKNLLSRMPDDGENPKTCCPGCQTTDKTQKLVVQDARRRTKPKNLLSRMPDDGQNPRTCCPECQTTDKTQKLVVQNARRRTKSRKPVTYVWYAADITT